MKYLLIACLALMGCEESIPTPSVGRVELSSKAKHGRQILPQPVASLPSSNGVLELNESMFADHPDAPVLFHNSFGSVAYGEPCFRLTMTDGSPIKPEEVNGQYTLLCALTRIYNPNPSNDVTLSASFDFLADISYEANYSYLTDSTLTAIPFPRYVVELH